MKKNYLFLLLSFLFCASSVFGANLNDEVEAEATTLSGGTDIVAKDFASGGTYVKLKNSSPKGSLTLSIADITTSGLYKLHVYSFNNGTAQTVNMSVNGGATTSVTLQPSNWAYEDSAKVTLLDVNLVGGTTNTITFTADASNALIDKLVVTDYFNVYYISATGDDTNDGSINSPWQTLTKATEVAKATNNGGLLNPGDKLLFKKGDTFEGQLTILCSGTEAKPIEIGSYGIGELPIISGSGNIPNGDNIEAVKMTNTSYITMDGLWIKNDRQNKGNITWATNTSIGIKVYANKWGGISKGLTFRNLKITDVFGIDMIDWEGKFTLDYYTAHGIFFDSEKDDETVSPIKEIGIEDVLIEGCYFYNIGSRGVNVRHLTNISNNPIDEQDRNMNFVIRNNTFEKLGGDGIVFASLCNGLVENNDFIDLGWGDHTSSTDRYFGRGEGCWIWNARNIIVQFNRQLRASGFGDTYGAGGHVDFFCKNAIYQYNYSEETAGGFCEILGECVNSTFRYNVSVNDGYRDHHGYTIWVSGFVGSGQDPVRSDSNFVYNNTIYIDKAYTPDISIWAKNTYVYNNVFKAVNGGQIGATGVEVDIESGSELVVSNNLFYGDVATAFTSLDNNKITGQDPQFVNEGSGDIYGYQLASTSAAIDAGKSFPEPSFPMAGQGIFKNISLHTATDIYGNEVDVNNLIPNIGADNNFNSKYDASTIRVTGVSLSGQSGVFEVGTTQQFSASLSPNNATIQGVTWTTSDNSVATVDVNGLVTAISEGTATITATTDDGGFTATASVNIGAAFEVEVLNSSFESGLTNWNTWNGPAVVTDAVYGSSAVKLTGKGSVNQWVTVKPNTTYTLSAFAKVVDPSNDKVVLGVNDENNVGIASVDIYDTSYTLQNVMFTTGANTDSVKIYFWRPANGVQESYVDEFTLEETAYILNADFEKGLHAWVYWGGNVSVETAAPYAGSSSVKINNGYGGINQLFKTKPSTTYEVTFTAKVEDSSTKAVVFTENSSGTDYVKQDIYATSFTEYSITFTTDADDEDTRVSFWRPTGAVGGAWMDNMSIKEVPAGTRTGITEVLQPQVLNFNVFPNPASDFVTIQTNQTDELKSLVLYNIVGQPVLSQTFKAEYKLSVADLNKGTYILVVTDQSGNRQTSKLFVD